LAALPNKAKEGFVMATVPSRSAVNKNDFVLVTEPFVHGPGLPFAEVLDAEFIHQVFHEEDALFAQDDIFSTEVVLWAFLAQSLRDGKGAACAAAVDDIITYKLQTGQASPAGDTGDYCRARAKLSLPALQRLVTESSRQVERRAQAGWLWKGHHAKLVDGFSFTMPDTPENQAEFPQPPTQARGVGLPIARVCAVLSLATACICDLAVGPWQGKQTGENSMLRGLLDTFDAGDVIVFDRYFCSYLMLALLSLRGLHVCTRQHQRRRSDFRRGRRLGPQDHLVTWTRPKRPAWMSEAEYARIPETLTLRELRFQVEVPGRRTKSLTVITTLTDARKYTAQEIAGLYGYRWNAELDIRSIKQGLGLDHVRCKTPPMVRRELWVTLLAYNLIRKVMATSAAVRGKEPRRLGFTRACQTVLASWILWSTGSCRNPRAMHAMMLEQIAAHEVANRPGRIEPRVLKRRRHHYPLMQRPRDELRAALAQSQPGP
jgi:hypothetical protein